MHIDARAADHFIRDGALSDSWVVRAGAPDGAVDVPADEDRPGLERLRRSAHDLVDHFTPSREDLWDCALPGWRSALDGVLVHLVVGWPAPYDAGVRTDPAGREVIVVDLARLLRGGDREQARAVVQQMLDHECAHAALRAVWPLPDEASYRDMLSHCAFDEGLAHFLAMHAHPALAPSAAMRDVRRRAARQAFGDALAEEDVVRQRELLRRADSADDFWDKFACVAGMFAFADAAHETGPDGVRALVAGGWRRFADGLVVA